MKLLSRVLKIQRNLTSLASDALEVALAGEAASQDSWTGSRRSGMVMDTGQEKLRRPEDSGADQTRAIMDFVKREGKLVEGDPTRA